MAKGIPKNGINKGWFKNGVSPKPYKHPPQCGFQKKHKDFNTEESRKKQKEKIEYQYRQGKRISFFKNKKGEKHPKYIKDRSKLLKGNYRNNPASKEWRKNIFERDGYICKINNNNCKGKLETHHILGWEEYPELRYEINNGITLCHAHHPKKRAEEKKLIPIFTELVKNQK